MEDFRLPGLRGSGRVEPVMVSLIFNGLLAREMEPWRDRALRGMVTYGAIKISNFQISDLITNSHCSLTARK